jgi:ATP-binding cassette subfamily B protein
MHERTVIAVAHRLSTLTGFDRIIVVRDGQIEEDGSIAELLGRRGAFARMWRLQAAGLSTAGLQVDPTVETEALSQPA